jgi:hypothetical protein
VSCDKEICCEASMAGRGDAANGPVPSKATMARTDDQRRAELGPHPLQPIEAARVMPVRSLAVLALALAGQFAN